MRSSAGGLAIALLLAVIAGCSGGGGNPNAFGGEPVECGELTCSGSEMCVAPASVGPFFDGPAAHACAPIPDGCGGLKLCSCPALADDHQGYAVINCSLLGERSIYVADLTCGDRLCSDTEYCLIRHDSATGVSSSYECRPAPAACAGATAFCGDGGCFTETTVDGAAVQLCLESRRVRAISVNP